MSKNLFSIVGLVLVLMATVPPANAAETDGAKNADPLSGMDACHQTSVGHLVHINIAVDYYDDPCRPQCGHLVTINIQATVFGNNRGCPLQPPPPVPPLPDLT